MELKDKIMEDLKKSMKEKNAERVNVLRLLRGNIRKVEIDTRKDLKNDEVLKIISKAAKQRRDSIKAYTDGNRQDLSEIEEKELEIILEYLPVELSDEKLTDIIKEVIIETGASGMKDIGRVMGPIMKKVNGQADGSRIQSIVRSLL